MKALPLNLAFVLTGAATTLLGSMTPLLESRWRIGDAEAGLLFTTQFFTSVLASVAVGPLARRYGYQGVVIGGLALTAVGMVGCALASWPSGVAAIGAFGAGLGFTITGANLAAATGPDGARAVVWLNWNWCIGAVAAPYLTAQFGILAWWIGAAGMLLCAGILALAGAGSRSVPREAASPVPRVSLVSRYAVLAAALLFIYVATEQAVSGWVASLALRDPATAHFWAAAPSLFWAGVLAGRAISPSLLASRRPSILIYVGLAIAAAGVLVLIVSDSAETTLAAGAICGLGLAPVYPLIVAQYAASVSDARGPSGAVLAAGGLGGAVGPLATGFISQMTGSLRLGLGFALPASAAMFWLQRKYDAAACSRPACRAGESTFPS